MCLFQISSTCAPVDFLVDSSLDSNLLVDLLVTCLPLQSGLIGDTFGDFVSCLPIIVMNYIQVIPDC